ncbi:MAG: HAD-IIA family hydrolase, partial [Chloroflexota bacterium]
MKFNHIEGAVVDMDGVLWRSNTPLPAMEELFQWFDEHKIPYVLATNNSGKTPADYVEKLASLGVPDVAQQNIITSGTATAIYMQGRYPPGARVSVFGMPGLKQIIAEAGYDVVDDPDVQPDVVVAGINFDMTYASLRRAALHIRAGADFIGTNPDLTFPTPEGLVPGAGSLIAALQAATDVEPFIVGKPYESMFRAALKITGTRPENTVMIGDRLDTDIQGAQQVGMKTVLLFTGVTSAEQLASPATTVWPDVAYEG